MLVRKNIQPPSCLRCTVLRKERLSSQGRQRGYNKLTFIVEIPRYVKDYTFVERSTQYTSFSSRKQPANTGTERKQFTENASVALQQPILTHAHTKCPPVAKESIKTKPESGNCFFKLRLIVMSTNLEYRARERQRVVVVQNDGKEMYKKSVLHVQSCFFAD